METTKEFSPLAGHSPTVDLNFDRAKPLLTVGLCVTLVLFMTWLTMEQIPRLTPKLLPQRLAGIGYAEDIQGRVDSALRQAQQGFVVPQRPICAIIGFSGGQEGIDTQQLDTEDGCAVRYLGLCGACDGTMTGLRDLVAPLYRSPLQVQTVVMAINPFQLVVRPFVPSLEPTDIKHAADKRLLAGRRRLLSLFQLDTDPRYLDVDPWRPMTKNYFGVIPNRALEQRLKQYELRGYCEIANYDIDGTQGAALRGLIEQTIGRGATVVVALMPLHPELNHRLPAEATEKIRRIVGNSSVQLWDYQQAIEASGFFDVSHLNETGRTRFTSMLAKDLNERLEFDKAIRSSRPTNYSM